ncbi:MULTISPECIES: serine/threonine-protein kinase [unclassified Arthrobacter]|uniref:serine/threonine-protein kinase n=1 Tax=unclassified Arthrobacter TaxID=235627 RepID=UPI001C862DA6|nr:serine/threonine-protein kinase [Arthrobacter sp. MAHUQ-56]MBX7446221.1 serine/threonine protein kinase [Arthrobacter sp. MAHUQ-56]
MDDAEAPDIAGYDVGRLLGRGGSADVWLATEQRTGRQFAVKCFRPGPGSLGNPGVGQEEMRREIRILSVLDHPHLIRSHQAVPLAGSGHAAALTMDYAAGGSLAQLVGARGRISVGETVTVLTPIAQALGYLHGKGFTHSDVAPGNVLFTGQGKPMLSDVGVGRMIGDPGSTELPGTSGFLDPAPVDAVRAGLQPERDVYAAAALGWFCLTGEAPRRTADRPPLSLLVPGVPKELALALEAGLNEDRRQRPTAMALATAVYRSAAPLPVDLADAVHPSVIPELLTRRHDPVRDSGAGLTGKLRGMFRGVFRRAATCRLTRRTPSPPRMPFPQAAHTAPLRGKHADSRARGRAGSAARVLRGAAVPVLAAAGAGIWWLSAVTGTAPGGQVSGLWPAPAASLVAGPGAGDGTGAKDGTGSKGSGTDAARVDTAGIDTARQQARSEDPLLAVTGMAALRDHALSSGSLELLEAVNAPGSPAAAADQRLADQLDGAGLRLEGFTSTVSDLSVADGAAGGRAVVRLTSATSAYRTVDAGGAEVAAGTPSPAQRLRLVLVRMDGQWRISEILPGG